MRPLIKFFALLVVFMVTGLLTRAQGTQPASQAGDAASETATKAEVNQLRSEVAAQRQTIEELKAMVEKLAAGQARASDNVPASSAVQMRPVAAAPAEAHAQPPDAPGASTVRLTNAILVQPSPGVEAAMVDQAPPEVAAKRDAPLTAGGTANTFSSEALTDSSA